MASEGEVPWRHLHPASLLVNLVPTAWRTVYRAWPLLVAVAVQRSVEGAVNLGFIAVFVVMAMTRTILHFATLRYRFAHGRLEIQEGLIARVERALDPSRIQNVSLEQNLFHRMAGLVELRVEMAGQAGSATDGLLSALSIAEAEALRQALGRDGAAVAAPTADHPVHDRASLLEVVAYGVSAGRVGAAIIVMGIVFDILRELGGGGLEAAPASLSRTAWMGLLLLAVAGGYALSVGSAVLRWYQATWWTHAQVLHFEAGLFTRRRMDIPLSKVQLVQVSEPILRRWMGFATLQLDTAANGFGPSSAPMEGLVPMVAAEDVPDRVARAFPELDTPIEGALSPAAPRAISRAALRGALRWSALAALVHFVGGGALAWGLIPVGALVGWLDGRRQGWALTERFLVVRRGFLSRETWVLPREKVQSARVIRTPLDQLTGLAQVVVWFPGGRLPLPGLRAAEAAEVFSRLERAVD